MEQSNCIIERSKYKHLTEKERYKIEGYLESKLLVKENKYQDFFENKFKSITFDNGGEFLDWEAIEKSRLRSQKRTLVYFARPYSSWKRGTNESQNRMIRRFIPKGTDISKISDKEIKKIEKWMNNYPRKILGYRTANDLVLEITKNRSEVLS